MRQELALRDQELARFPTLEQVVKRKIVIRNDTASSPHTSTGHRPATWKKLKNGAPKVELDEKFWQVRGPYPLPEDGLDGEKITTSFVERLIERTIALDLKAYVSALRDVPIMGTEPDLTLITRCNKRIIGIVEVKKPPMSGGE
jgi:hypothetical protein